MDDRTTADALKGHLDLLWDALAMIDGIVRDDDFRESGPDGQYRLARMAAEKLHEFDKAVSDLV